MQQETIIEQEDETAILTIKHGKIIYAIGTDIDFSERGLTHTIRRIGKLGTSAQRMTLTQILEKTSEESQTILDEAH